MRTLRLVPFPAALGCAILLVCSGPLRTRAQTPPSPSPSASPEPKPQLEFRLDGYLNADTRYSLEGGPETFLLRRARVGIAGTAYRFVDFRYLVEFASSEVTAVADIQDAYLNVRLLPQAQVQIGQFKVPFGREWASSAHWIDFIERATVSDETRADRQMGAALHGTLGEERLEYWLGTFNGTRVNRPDDNDAKELLFRVVLQPIQGLYAGGTFTTGDQGPQPGVRGRTPIRSATFFPADTVRGSRQRRGAEVAWFRGPFSLSGEYLATSEEVAESTSSTKPAAGTLAAPSCSPERSSRHGGRCARWRTSTHRRHVGRGGSRRTLRALRARHRGSLRPRSRADR
ncbi:MAG: hypothetical protein H0V09_06275 [Gemmatimonadetes bacterium]|nr:hypothetical protein [Gemmatimonadota bacterium]